MRKHLLLASAFFYVWTAEKISVQNIDIILIFYYDGYINIWEKEHVENEYS